MFLKKSLILLCLLGLVVAPLSAQRKKKAKDDAKTEEVEKKDHYLNSVSTIAMRFRSIGPAITSGRIADIAMHPDTRSTYYVATASGGVWKTTNAGTTYKPIFDRQGSYSIGCITLDPNNPNVVWVGTGENNNQRSVGYGDGIYKSNDGGSSWKHMGLKNSEHIGRIIVHPENSDVVYVAAIGPLWSEGGERGVYKTTNGGKDWELVLEIDEHTGVTDIMMDLANPDVLYAAAYQRRRHVFTYVGGGPGSTVYKSTDGGDNWEKSARGLPSGDVGRIGFAQSPANPEVIYAMIEAQNGSGVYRTTNRGASWQKRSSYFTRGNYYTEIFAHPHDENTLYSMNTYNQWSTDGGKTWKSLGERYKHVDNHFIWIDPKDPDYHLVGCDGGIYETFDAAKTWVFKANLPVTQFYKVAVDNDAPFYNVYGGTQDNFSLGGPSRTTDQHGIDNMQWFVTQGGDGFESQIDPKNPNIIYAQAQYGGIVRFDKASGERIGIQPKPRKGEKSYRWNWDAPLAVSAHVDQRIYFAANKLFKSDDRGNSWDVISDDLTRQVDRNKLKVMGRVQSIDAVAKNASTSQYGTIVAFSESPMNRDLLVVGTDDGLIQITENGGQAWRSIDCNTFPGAPERSYVNAVLASQHDENVIYAILNHHKYGDFKPYVFKSTDKGASWMSINANLPERGSAYTIAEDHVDPDLLFVGTEFACFFSKGGGDYWKKVGGLPTVAVRDIAIQQRENDLVIATFGRGFYILDDYSPLRGLTEENLQADASMFPIKPGLMYVQSAPLGWSAVGFQGHSYFRTPNPQMGVQFTYHVKEKIKTLKQQRQEAERKAIKDGEEISYPSYEDYVAELEEEKPMLEFVIKDEAGNIVRKLTGSYSTGVKRKNWSGRLVDLSPASKNRTPGDGIMAMPGNYTVTLYRHHNGETKQLTEPEPFELKALEGTTLPAESREALVAFQKETADFQRVFSGATNMMNMAGDKVGAMKKAVLALSDPSTDWMSELNAIEDQMAAIRKDIYGDRRASTLDMDTEPSISSRLYGMAYAMYNSTSAPTQTMRSELTLAKEAFGPVYEKLKALVNSDIKAMESKLEAAGAPYTPGRMMDFGRN
ncbi:MAG: glycosyl hydrolase [Bacteroidota bacterium]